MALHKDYKQLVGSTICLMNAYYICYIVVVVVVVVVAAAAAAAAAVHNLGVIFDEHLTFSDQISSLSKSCYSQS